MNKKTRYLLIFVGFVLFLILAPLIVMYVRGVGYDFASQKFVQTGILAVRTEPKNANIYLDGKLQRQSSGDIKFLIPKEYNLEIKQEPYAQWSKRLEVKSGQVTWANPLDNKIFLFFEQPKETIIASHVLDMYANDNTLLYLTNGALAISSTNDVLKNENFTLTKPVNKIIASGNGSLFALIDTQATSTTPTVYIFNQGSRSLVDISQMFIAVPLLKFAPNNDLFALENGTLYKVDLSQKIKVPLFKQVKAFSFQESNLYYIKQALDGSLSLMVSQSLPNEGTVLSKNLPAFTQGEIIINFEKHVFLMLDKAFYSVTSNLVRLADNVDNWNYNPTDSTVIFSHAGELSFYNPFTDNIQFITRSGQSIGNPLVKLDLVHAFAFKDKSLVGLELDTRNHQNEYTFYQAQDPKKFLVDKDARKIFVLDGDQLKILTIR